MCSIYVELLCVVRFGLGWAMIFFLVCMSHVYAFSCIRTFISLYSNILMCLVLFYMSLFLPFPFFLSVSCFMAPKQKSTLSQNPLCSRASSSFDPTPSHVWFRDEKARKDFSENISKWGIHSKRQVILSDFSDTDLSLSSTVGVKSHCVASWSRALPWS